MPSRSPTRERIARPAQQPAAGQQTPEPAADSGLHTLGNQEQLRALGVRAKLSISQPGDPDEREADEAAEAFVSGRAAPALSGRGASELHRQCSSCDDEALARKAAPGAREPPSGELAERLPHGRGQSLAPGLRREYESFFRADLSSVRVNDDEQAHRASAALNARAFAYRGGLYFGRDEFAPKSLEGRRLLAHEIAHLMQPRPAAQVRRQDHGTRPSRDMDAGVPPSDPVRVVTSSGDSASGAQPGPMCPGVAEPDATMPEPISCEAPPAIQDEVTVSLPQLDESTGELLEPAPVTFNLEAPVQSVEPLTLYAVPRELVFATEEEAREATCRREEEGPLISPPPITGIAWTARGPIRVIYLSSDFVVTVDYVKFAVGAAAMSLARTANGLVLVDAGVQIVGRADTAARAAMQQAALQQLETLTAGEPIERVLLTHTHADHMNMLEHIAERIEIRVIQLTARAAAQPGFERALRNIQDAQARYRANTLPQRVRARMAGERDAWVRERPLAEQIDPARTEAAWEAHVESQIQAAQAAVRPPTVELLIGGPNGPQLVQADIQPGTDAARLEARVPQGTQRGARIEAPLRQGPITTFTHPETDTAATHQLDAHSANYILDLPNGEQIIVVADLRDRDLAEVRQNFERAVHAAGSEATFRVVEAMHHMQQGFVERTATGPRRGHLVGSQFLVDASVMLAELAARPGAGGRPVRSAVVVGGAESRISPANVWLARALGYEVFITTDVSTVQLLGVLYGESERAAVATGTPRAGGRPSVALAMRAGLSISQTAQALAALDAQIQAGTAPATATADRATLQTRLTATRRLLHDYQNAVELEIGRAPGGARPAVAPAQGTQAGVAAAQALTSHLDSISAAQVSPETVAPLTQPVLVLIDRHAGLTLTERQAEIRDRRLRVEQIGRELAVPDPPQGLRVQLMAEMELLRPLMQAEMAGLPPEHQRLFQHEIDILTTAMENLSRALRVTSITGADPASGGRTRTRIMVEQPIRPEWTAGRQRLEKGFGVFGRISGAAMIYHSVTAQTDLYDRAAAGSATELEGLAGTVHNTYGAMVAIRMVRLQPVHFGEFVVLAILDFTTTAAADYASREEARVAMAYSALRNTVNLALFWIGGAMMRSANPYVAGAGFIFTLLGEPLLRLSGMADRFERWFSADPADVTEVSQELRELVEEYRTVVGALQLAQREAEQLRTLGATDPEATRAAARQAIDAHRQEARGLEPDVLEAFDDGYRTAGTSYRGLRALDALREMFLGLRSQVWADTDRGQGSRAEDALFARFRGIESRLDLSSSTEEEIAAMDQWDDLDDHIEDMEETLADALEDGVGNWPKLLERFRDLEQRLDNARYRLEPQAQGPYRMTPLLAPGSTGRAFYERALAVRERRVSSLQAQLNNVAGGSTEVDTAQVSGLVGAVDRLHTVRIGYETELQRIVSTRPANAFDALWGTSANIEREYQRILESTGMADDIARLEAREAAMNAAMATARSMAGLDADAQPVDLEALQTEVDAAGLAINQRRDARGIVLHGDLTRLAQDVRSAEEAHLERSIGLGAPLTEEEGLALRSDELEDVAVGVTSVTSQLALLRTEQQATGHRGLQLFRLVAAEGCTTRDWVTADPSAIVGYTGQSHEGHNLCGGFTEFRVVPISAAAVRIFASGRSLYVDQRNLDSVTVRELGVRPKANSTARAEAGTGVPRAVGAVASGAGAPLPQAARASMEDFFGADLSRVRIHADAASAQAARALDAQAFASGNDVFFDAGRYDAQSPAGRRLLAHEVAHTLQDAGTAIRRQDNAPPASQCNVEIRLGPHPWLYEASPGCADADISLALYGIELPVERPGEIAYPALLVVPYRGVFHQRMRDLLGADVERVDAIVRNAIVGEAQREELLALVQAWRRWSDVSIEEGNRTYFDEFLARLRDNSDFDELFRAMGERAGALNTLVAQGSVEFGGYRPLWAELERRAQDPGATTPAEVNPELVERSASMVLDALEGPTSSADSALAADTLSGLPPREQAAVLRRIMSRYDERHWTYILSRYGEAWEGGMLYWLFEDLDEADRQRVARALIESGVLREETVAQLLAGRGLGGEYLPYTTYHGQKAADFWADTAATNEGSAAGYAAWAPGLFASLWTPQTAGSTAITLGTAGLAPGIGEAFPTVGRGLLVVGTGVTAYGTTLAIQELVTGRDAYTGRDLDDVDKLARVLQAVSGMLLLAAGFMQASALSAPPASGSSLIELPPGEGAPGRAGNVRFRVIRVDGDEYTVLGQHTETGETAVLRVNCRTGDGTATHMGTGEVIPIRGWVLQQPPFGLLQAGQPLGSATGGTGLTEVPPLPASGAIAGRLLGPVAGPVSGTVLGPVAGPVAGPVPGPDPVAHPTPTPAPSIAPPLDSEFGTPDIFEEMQSVVPEAALFDEALEAGLSEGVVPSLHYYDPVSGDYLPYYYNADTGVFSPYSMEAMATGNVFNELANWGYPVHELTLRTRVPAGRGSTVRLDSYDPAANEIVSRKYTQLGAIDQFDALNYLQELVIKYPDGAEVASTPATRAAGLAGTVVRGTLVLEVPVQQYDIPELALEYANSRGIMIRDSAGHIYNP